MSLRLKKLALRLMALVLTLAILAPPIQVAAISAAQKEVLDTGIYYFNTEDNSCTLQQSVDLSGNDNAEKTYNYFISKGLTPIQAAAILGNFQRESGINPKRIQGGGESDSVPMDGKTGYGLAQWTFLARQQALSKFATSQNRPVSSLDLQLDFAWQEASGGPVLGNFKSINSVETATEYWMLNYEAPDHDPNIARLDLRITYARSYLAKYGGNSVSQTDSSAASICSDTVGPGQNTQYVDGFTVYSQYDPSWSNKPYGTSTIAKSGCGPSAMAMIVTALTDKQITPDKAASYADAQNIYIPGAGSSWIIAPVLAKHWGLNSELIGAKVAKINSALLAGGLVIASGQGPKPFTTGGHYIVIRGITPDGQWKVGDSGHNDTSDKSWDPQMLVNYMNDGSVYAITK